jgi:hypothetical protein
MIYEPAPSEEQLSVLRRWLVDNSPIFVDDFWCHAGGSTPQYFIRSADDFLKLISTPARPRRIMSVFRHLYPLRGVANDELITRALELIGPEEAYAITFLEESNYYPATCEFADGGYRGHTDLKRDLQSAEVAGRLVAVGLCPFNGDETWIRTSPDVLRFDLRARPQ